jgi:hypothetical protein
LQRDRLGLTDGTIFGTETVAAGSVDEKSTLQVGVSKESQGRRQGEQGSERVAERNSLFVFIVRGTVNQLHTWKICQLQRPMGH